MGAEDRPYLGVGWAFPPAFDAASGRAGMVAAEDDIREALTILLLTRPGERIMTPRFGLDPGVFERIDAGATADLRRRVSEAIIAFEPRARLLDVAVETDAAPEGRLDIRIAYEIPEVNVRGNMVIPYHLEEGSRIGLDDPAERGR